MRSSGVQPKQIIYLDEGNRTLSLDPSCWENGPVDSPREYTGVALDGAEPNNSTIVIVKQKCKNVPMADAPDGTPCPTWFLPDPSANGTCRCGNDIHGAVSCNDLTKEVGILNYYCMTYNESTGPLVGPCFYNHMNQTSEDTLYLPVPSNTTEVNMCMCGFFNRAGQLCGKCEQNHCIPIYSYDMKCVQCSVGFGWVKYILAAFLPLTVFFILVLSCRLMLPHLDFLHLPLSVKLWH